MLFVIDSIPAPFRPVVTFSLSLHGAAAAANLSPVGVNKIQTKAHRHGILLSHQLDTAITSTCGRPVFDIQLQCTSFIFPPPTNYGLF